MAGFDNDVVYATNVDFSGGSPVSGKILTDGQLLIGRTSPNTGGTHIDVNTLTAGSGISITNGTGTITIAATGVTAITYTEDSGTATPDGSGNVNILGTAAQGISTSGSSHTITLTNADWTTSQKGVGTLATNAETIAGAVTTKAVTPDDLKAKLGAQTLHGLAIGAGPTNAINWTAAPTNGQILIGSTGSDPTLGTITGGTGITVVNGAGSVTISATGITAVTVTTNSGTATSVAGNIEIKGKPATPITTESPGAGSGKTVQIDLGTVTPGFGGTGVVNPTAHTLPVAEGSSNFNFLGPLTNGQLLIGVTGSDPVPGTITGGTGITIVNGGGTITVSVNGSVVGETITGDTGGALSPTAGNWNIIGGSQVAGTNPIQTTGSGSTLTVKIQRAQAIAAADSTKIGAAAFDSARFTVDANGFVSANGSGLGETITGQSGGALSPSSGNWNIFGGTVVAGTAPLVTSGSGSTLTINAQRTQAIASTDSTKIGMAAFDSARFTADANGFVSINGSGVGETITGDSGPALSPIGGNWNITGYPNGTVPNMFTTGSGSTLKVEDRTWLTSYVVDPSTTAGSRGTFSTIQSAITAASSGTTIFIRPGTYTENLTLKAGVNLTTLPSTGSELGGTSATVTINGKCTFSSSGTVSITGIQLQTNSDYYLVVSGASISTVNLQGCYLNCTNNSGISFTNSNASSSIDIQKCTANLNTTGITHFISTSPGNITFKYSYFGNSGNSITPSTSNATCVIFVSYSDFLAPITITGTSTLSGSFSHFGAPNATCLTCNGTGNGNQTQFCSFFSGTASAISVGATDTVYLYAYTRITSSNTNAITGSGILVYGPISFSNSFSATVNTTTQIPMTTGPRLQLLNGGPQILAGSGSPSGAVTAATNSLYLRSDGSSTTTRLYVNTDGGTTWAHFTASA